MKRSKKNLIVGMISITVWLSIIIFLFLIGRYNYLFDYSEFLKMNLFNILSLVATFIALFSSIIVAYFLVQLRTDERKKKDLIERIVSNIQANINQIDRYDVNHKEHLLSKQRYINTRIKTLKDYGLPCIEDEVIYIEKEFDEIRDIISELLAETGIATEIEIRLTRSIKNIDLKLDVILFKLYESEELKVLRNVKMPKYQAFCLLDFKKTLKVS